MPSEPTAEQLELRRKGRQRLIGAVALALLAVVFVPMLLDPEPRRERAEPLLAIPPRDVAPPLPAAPKLPEASAEAGKVVEAAKVAPADAAMAAPATPEPPAAGADRVPAGESRKTVEPKAAEFKKAAPKAAPAKGEPAKAETAKTDAAKADPAKTEVPRLEGYAVQVGAFKDEAKLKQAREKLTAAGISHFIDRQPDFTRLRAGPFPTREAAESALPAVKRAGLDGRVVPLP